MLKKGELGQLADLRGGDLGRKRVVVFLRGGLTPQCTLCLKRGTLGQSVDLRGEGGLERKRGMVFLRGYGVG